MAAIQPYTGVSGVKNAKVPTFADAACTEEAMSAFKDEAYNNILYTSVGTEITNSFKQLGEHTGNAWTQNVYYAPDTVVLYDGSSEIRLPVMAMAEIASGDGYRSKTMYIYSIFPGNDNGDNTDGWYLSENWRSGNGTTAHWDWAWQQTTGSAAYNYALGKQNTWSESVRTGPQQTNFFNAITTAHPMYLANVLKFDNSKGVADYGQEYYLDWYFTTGHNDNKDKTVTTATAPIRVLNVTTLSNAMQTNGNKMKNVKLSEFSEGGLEDYINAMEDAAQFDLNLYFGNSSDGAASYNSCVTAM